MPVKFADGVVRDVLPVGTRVRHREHPSLTGKIVDYEMCQGKVFSTQPYKVYWDQDDDAFKLLGWFFIYPDPDKLEVIPK